ncbi:MAG: phosphodiester glycosidase family protein [Streptomyces sp.]|uniref:phosphodiester glycosidase family protein n=1 Tax=Streptomyces sp. TaxID=1931 RepID=UPI0025DC4FB4|nr:phosphodiester glycosidase family protein [Streptomyces sp.]MBW8795691.1 phosphodiester glycosidase family protein [Streptomyces sp.]
MTHRRRRLAAKTRTLCTILTTTGVLAGAALTGAAPAGAASGAGRITSGAGRIASGAGRIASGVTYRQFDVPTARGTAHAHLLTVDLTDPHVHVDLLSPGAVAARSPVSAMADAAGAVAGVNGDFFNITEAQHPGVEATGASVGPAIAHGGVLKSAVPTAQRFGPSLPPGTDTTDVFGVGMDRRARLDRLTLAGTVRTRDATLTLRGLNQYALAEGSVGAYTAAWGPASRKRATCGSDTNRAAGCSTDTYEVRIRRGRVVATSGTPGSGAITAGTTVLLGREAGADRLRALTRGERVAVREFLVASASGIPYRFAVGGYPVLRGGEPLAGLNATTAAVRTAVGYASGGRRLLLLALDGAVAYRSGLTIAEVADEMRKLGAVDAFSLDGGGSTTMVARTAGAKTVSVLNHPTESPERAVANGIGVFWKP